MSNSLESHNYTETMKNHPFTRKGIDTSILRHEAVNEHKMNLGTNPHRISVTDHVGSSPWYYDVNMICDKVAPKNIAV